MSNRAKEIAAIMATYEPGEVWQYKYTYEDDEKWRDAVPFWDWSACNYRRKPEPPAPKYRPWTPEEGVGKVVRRKNCKAWCHMVTGYSAGSFILGSESSVMDGALLRDYTQPDGTPCGVLETPTTTE